MSITYVGAAVGGGNVSTFDLTWPAIAAGDVALVFWVMQNTWTPTTPSGFAVTATNDSSNGALRTYIFQKICDGSETGSLTLASTGVNRNAGGMSIYRGCDQTTPVNQVAWLAETVAGTTHANPAVTPTGDNCCIVTAVFERSTSGTTGWDAPAGFVETVDTLTAATGSGGTILAVADDGLDDFWPGGFPVTPPVWTSTNAFSTENVGTYTIALAAAIQVQAEQSKNAHAAVRAIG
jgi:hypothetical protein